MCRMGALNSIIGIELDEAEGFYAWYILPSLNNIRQTK